MSTVPIQRGVTSMCARNRRKTGVVMQTLSRFAGDEGGATSLEYGLIAGLVSMAILSAATSMGDDVNSIFTSLSTDLDAAASGIQN